MFGIIFSLVAGFLWFLCGCYALCLGIMIHNIVVIVISLAMNVITVAQIAKTINGLERLTETNKNS